jgi:coatomer subunit delta
VHLPSCSIEIVDVFTEPERERDVAPSPSASSAYVETRKAAPVKGMSLSAKSSKNKSLEDALVKEDKLAPILSSKVAAAPSGQTAVVEALPTIQQPVMLAIVEKVSAKVSRDGVVESYDIKGTLTLTASTDDAGLCSVQMRTGANVNLFSFNTHPKINKALYDKSALLQLKDVTKGFPSARPVGILKWNYSSTTDDLLPLKINCWPEEESRGRMIVSIEYTMDQSHLTLHDVAIKIPLGTSDPISVSSVDGTYKHSAANGEVVWQLPLIDRSNSSGTLEFTVAQRNSDAFFPIAVVFSSSQLLCQIDVSSVTTPNGATPIQYGLTKVLSPEEYVIE